MAGKTENRQALIDYVADLEEQKALVLVKARLQDGEDALAIIEDCQEGMRQVGLRYEAQQYYLSGLIMAGEIFREVMDIAQPAIEERHRGNESGRVLLGTVQGDIHDIGKNNLSVLLRCYGFTVFDLGIDVPPSVFLENALAIKPGVIGLSGLLISSYDAMRETIDLLHHAPDAAVATAPIVIGGSQINEEVCHYVGADYWVTDAMQGVRLCQKLRT